MKRWMTAVALVLIPVSARAMTVDQFLTKVYGLKAKGIFALASPDIGLLKREMTSILTDYRVDKVAAAKAGHPLNCAPKGNKMSQGEFIAALEAIPPAQRSASMKTAFYAIAARRWPCPS